MFICFIFYLTNLSAQSLKKITVAFHPMFGMHELNFNDSYFPLNSKDSIQIETLKFYISDIELIENNNVVWHQENSFHLIDIENLNTKSFEINIPSEISYTRIRFNLGIDSITNISGALGGDLDPTKGMYWTWQSGYINLKFEGKSNRCNNPKNEFQFHLGGYQYPYNCLQKINLAIENKTQIIIEMDLLKFAEKTELSKQHHIMSPSDDAVRLSQLFSTIFKVK